MLPRLLGDFLGASRDALVLEDGQQLFDLANARYSVTSDRGRCLLHLWSAEHNVVRRVLSAELKGGVLRIAAQRFGQAKPSRLEICLRRERGDPKARHAARLAYQQRFRRTLEQHFPGHTVERLSSAMDLERSFGPAYARALVRRGTAAFAAVGVNTGETQATVDASLTTALLWLDRCREQFAERGHVGGVKLLLPVGRTDLVRERMAHLDRSAAAFELYEHDEREGTLDTIETGDRGNIATRLVQRPNEAGLRERLADAVARVLELAPGAETAVLSSSEIGFSCNGLEFARSRLAPGERGFALEQQVVFGLGAGETPLTDENGGQLAELAAHVIEARQPHADRSHPLWRALPERWLEAMVLRNVRALDGELDPAHVYSQVPAFSAADRAMIDVLTVNRRGRLVVIELKADEDLQLPLQGLDYWARVRWHQERREFQRFGYFTGVELSAEPPLLYLVAPALRVHPATDALVRYFAPEVEVVVIGVDERWREGVQAVFRKRRA
jgi:hypothetical protein